MKYKVFDISFTENNAKKKNELIDQARTENYDYCFIKQIDVNVLDTIIYDKYCELMDKLKLGFIFYPYYRNTNRLFNKSPNVAINIKIKDKPDEYLQIVRQICRAFIGINLKLNNHKFNENLKVFELDEYCKRMVDNKLTLGLGLYPDVYQSWKYFEDGVKSGNTMTILKEDIEADKKYLSDNKIEFNIETNVDALLKRLIEEFGL